jgi:hypothetical protein
MAPPRPLENLPDFADEALGLPTWDEYAPEPFQPQEMRSPGILEALAGLEGLDLPRPRSMGEGFLYGLARGVGTAGSRAAQKRAQFEAQQRQRQAQADQERLQASREFRQARGSALRQRIGEQLRTKREQEDFERKNPALTEDDIKKNPWLAESGYGVGSRPPERIRALIAESHAPGADPLKSMTPQQRIKYEEDLAFARARGGRRGAPPVAKPAAEKPSSGQERSALAFYNRARDSENTIGEVDQAGVSLDRRVGLNPASVAKIAFATDHRTGNLLLNPDEQIYMQAQRQFTEARLRKESGAAISPVEYKNDAATYFAQPGDKAPTIRRKAAARQKVLDGLKFQSGKAFKEFYEGVQPEAASIDDEYEQYLERTGQR